MTATAPRCAVVFKTYAWDAFVERQARRLAEAAGALDFYISVDETGGPVGPIPFERVIRFTCAELAFAGLPCAMPWAACCGGIPITRTISFGSSIRITTITCSWNMTAWCNARWSSLFHVRSHEGPTWLHCRSHVTLRRMALDAVSAQCLSCRRGQACFAQRVFSVCSRVSHVASATACHERLMHPSALGRAVRSFYRARS